jgi:hypothetical protein
VILDFEGIEMGKDGKRKLEMSLTLLVHFAEMICTQLGIQFNTGKRGRPETAGETANLLPTILGQEDFRF